MLVWDLVSELVLVLTGVLYLIVYRCTSFAAINSQMEYNVMQCQSIHNYRRLALKWQKKPKREKKRIPFALKAMKALIVIAKPLSWVLLLINSYIALYFGCSTGIVPKLKLAVLLLFYSSNWGLGVGPNPTFHLISSQLYSTVLYTCVLSETPLKALHKQILY